MAASSSGPAGYAVFAGGGINAVGSLTVPLGDVASNGSISIGTFSKLGGGIYGAGDFNTAANNPGSSTFAGPMFPFRCRRQMCLLPAARM